MVHDIEMTSSLFKKTISHPKPHPKGVGYLTLTQLQLGDKMVSNFADVNAAVFLTPYLQIFELE